MQLVFRHKVSDRHSNQLIFSVTQHFTGCFVAVENFSFKGLQVYGIHGCLHQCSVPFFALSEGLIGKYLVVGKHIYPTLSLQSRYSECLQTEQTIIVMNL